MKIWFSKNLPVIAWAFLIFLGSSLPGARVSQSQVIDWAAHKAVHLFEYGVFYLLYYRSLVANFWNLEGGKVLKSLAFIFVFGVFDEFRQSFVPGRQSRVQDVTVDLVGGLVALSLWQFLRQKRPPKPKGSAGLSGIF